MRARERLTVAVSQIAPVLRDIEANVERHLEEMAKAREAGADLLVFPELSLTGYSVGADVVTLAMDRDAPVIHRLAEAAGDMVTVFGFVEEGVAAQFHNSAVAVHDGEIAFLHRKLNLPTYGGLEEGKHFAGGRFVDYFAICPLWRVSILVCADLWNPALAHIAASYGATLMIVPTASAHDVVGSEFYNPDAWDLAVRFYATMYGMPVVLANRVGTEDGSRFWGGSVIVDAMGHVVAQAGDAEEMIVAPLEYDQVRRARYRLPTVRDSNLELVYRELGRIRESLGIPPESRKL